MICRLKRVEKIQSIKHVFKTKEAEDIFFRDTSICMYITNQLCTVLNVSLLDYGNRNIIYRLEIKLT